MEGGKRKEPKSAVRIRKRFITELTIRLQDEGQVRSKKSKVCVCCGSGRCSRQSKKFREVEMQHRCSIVRV